MDSRVYKHGVVRRGKTPATNHVNFLTDSGFQQSEVELCAASVAQLGENKNVEPM